MLLIYDIPINRFCFGLFGFSAVGYAPGFEPPGYGTAHGSAHPGNADSSFSELGSQVGGHAQSVSGYDFINGDAGDGAVFPSTPEGDLSLAAAAPDYSGMNGAAAMEPQPVYDPTQQQPAPAAPEGKGNITSRHILFTFTICPL